MTKHPDLSKGYLKTQEAKQKSKYLWTNLSNDLNAEGPPQRDVVGWKKVWADFKVHTKGKLRKNKANLSGTGGGPCKYTSLTPIEAKVAELLDLVQAVEGMSGTSSFGLEKHNLAPLREKNNDPSSNNEEEDECIASMYDAVVTDVGNIASVDEILSGEKENVSQPRILPKKLQKSLLEKQVENQISYHKNSCEVMKNINENLKGILKYKRRDTEINEKIYKLNKENLELKKQKCEYKKKSHRY